ncbi:MAG: S8 family serine peptidase [Chloroflexaceae bacterium]|nr:S8 family serine peptidase [Chloroflexaceae bacterium]
MLATLAMVLGPLGPAQAASPSDSYIVMLREMPSLAYAGGIPGLRATAGIRDRSDPNVQRYAAFLQGRQDAMLNSVGGGRKLYSYRHTLNGFAAELTAAQAAQLARDPAVFSVTPNEKVQLETFSTPDFLGLTKPGGLWGTLGGPASAGEGVIIGILDSGIWPENPSFADDGNFRSLARWKGECLTGEAWTADNCSGKVIGARHYNATWGGDSGVKELFPWEVNSARDVNGHGSHTASTAGGNYNVPASAEGTFLGNISGMAPRARIAVYKVCWDDGASGTCGTIDSVAAIEDAAMDGVDVLNFSISGSRTSVVDPVEFAFLQASAAGVFVAASAGNSGPAASTVAHNSPWITTVAASTHDRDYVSSVTLGNGASYAGKSLGSGTAVAPLIDATAAGLPGADPAAVRLCFGADDNGGTPVLDPAKIAGKIVICDRGVTARVNKSLAVKQAGGIGVIMTNVSPNSLNADLHFVPTIHVADTARDAIKAYAATAGATAQIAPGQRTVGEAPFMAAFSSRGPALAINGNLLKPDITAPGVDVFAAVAPPGNAGRDFDFYSGTSMSSPHVAGLAALLKDLYPAWTPSMIKSALMTTASQVTNQGNPIRNDTGSPANPFNYGAGHANPNGAQNPGLVYAARTSDYVAFLCGQRLLNDPRCPRIAIDASNLNLPSVAISNMAGTQTVQRTVTNVGTSRATYTASVSGLDGITATVTPSSLTLNPGESKSFQIAFGRTTAALNTYAFGALTWTSDATTVRSPLAIRPVAIAAPGTVTSNGSATTYGVRFGYNGPFSAQPRGLVPATAFNGTLTQSGSQFVPGAPDTVSFTVDIPAGTEYARFALFDNATTPGSDLDLFVFRGSTQVAASAGGTSDEQVNLVKPAAGTYTVWVHAYAFTGTSTSFTQFNWAVTAASAGNMAVSAPGSATLGTNASVSLAFSGLAPATRYLGTVTYHNVAAPTGYDDGRIGTTLVEVNTP